ncbi:MAG: futalosine hydrolase [Phycisphaerales bacterium]|jgi:futalosine hydrolase|nr:futalosine hydrolase [Phycisphaerales bacterium]
MTRVLDALVRGKRLLIVVAAPAEAQAIVRGVGKPTSAALDHRLPDPHALIALAPRVSMLVTGVGKAAAAEATAWTLASTMQAASGASISTSPFGGVLNLGIAGALPAGAGEATPSADRLGRVVLGTASVLGDEGVWTDDRFITLDTLGFGPMHDGTLTRTPTPAWLEVLSPLAHERGGIATVSVCSGSDALAYEVASRTGAIAEAMEGAAIGLAAARASSEIGFAELRVLSNTTGARSKQLWRMREALETLGALARQIIQ